MCIRDRSKTLNVVSAEQYQDFLLDRNAVELTPLELGTQLFANKGCTACHNVANNNRLVGPGLKGLFKSKERKFADGTSAVVDENYVSESILYPNKKIVQGYAPAMPAFEGQLNKEELRALITYLKSL